mmetsp:Transcript_47079/g.111826  ORF Transcript_47079/g.111826 Transcript_47079/m.111826 type:complete len:235 (-) Transcript_47079:37-741(-)
MDARNELDLSPGFLEAARRQLGKLKVKNTFIDVVDSDDERPVFGAVVSCPVKRSEEELYEPGDLPEIAGPRSAPPPLPRHPEGRALQHPCLLTSPRREDRRKVKVSAQEDTRPSQEEESSSSIALQKEASSSSAAPKKTPKTWPPIEPLETRRPQQSLGSQMHGTTSCKPCAWFWRPQGCANGEECGHCHLCSAAELKARKKAKKNASQRLKSAALAQEAAQVLAVAPGPVAPQ